MLIILVTHPGEGLMQPDFGGGVFAKRQGRHHCNPPPQRSKKKSGRENAAGKEVDSCESAKS